MSISEWKRYQQDGRQELEAATKDFLFELEVYKLGLQHYKNGLISKTQRKQYRKNFCKKWKIKACAEIHQEYVETELAYAYADRKKAFIEAAQQKEKLLNAEAEAEAESQKQSVFTAHLKEEFIKAELAATNQTPIATKEQHRATPSIILKAFEQLFEVVFLAGTVVLMVACLVLKNFDNINIFTN